MSEGIAAASVAPDPDVLLVKMIATAFKNSRIPLNSEKATQQHLAQVFTAMGILHAREFRLGDGDIVDFFVRAKVATVWRWK
jgi:hypothetical protein